MKKITQAEISKQIIPLILPEHNNIKPVDGFNKGYLRAIEIVQAKAPSVIEQALSSQQAEFWGMIEDDLIIKCECEDANCVNCKRALGILENLGRYD